VYCTVNEVNLHGRKASYSTITQQNLNNFCMLLQIMMKNSYGLNTASNFQKRSEFQIKKNWKTSQYEVH